MVEKGKKDVTTGTPESTGTITKESSWADKKVTRRTVLKGAAAAAAGLAAGPVITGFPTIWAQKTKDIVLHHVGASYSAIIDIARQATKDLGFKVEMQALAHDALRNRLVTQPKTVDVADT